MRKLFRAAAGSAIVLLAAPLPALAARPSGGQRGAHSGELVYVGTQTSGASRGIYAYRFDPSSGHAAYLGLEAVTPNPTFLAAAGDGRTLYAVNEDGSAAGGGTVSSFRVDAHSGHLTFLNKVSSAGTGPCDLALAHKTRFLLVSNCSSGSVALLPILADGSLAAATSVVQHHGSSINPERQAGPHAHSVAISLDDRFAFVADLGVDRVFIHPIDLRKLSLSAGTESAKTAPGGGVRHVALSPNGRFLYSIDELDSALTVFRFSRGKIQRVDRVFALPRGAARQRGGSELAFDTTGRFLYASVRGNQNTIAVFSINPRNGFPQPLQFISSQGIMPRNFALDRSGTWLAVADQKSHTIAWLRRNPATGRLRPAEDSSGQVDTPMCIVFVRAPVA